MPVAMSQVPASHTTGSLPQPLGCVPAVARQRSVVHKFESCSQRECTGTCVITPLLHVPSVQLKPSSVDMAGMWLQTFDMQASVVQASPSSQ
jgi:hypothetical protein